MLPSRRAVAGQELPGEVTSSTGRSLRAGPVEMVRTGVPGSRCDPVVDPDAVSGRSVLGAWAHPRPGRSERWRVAVDLRSGTGADGAWARWEGVHRTDAGPADS